MGDNQWFKQPGKGIGDVARLRRRYDSVQREDPITHRGREEKSPRLTRWDISRDTGEKTGVRYYASVTWYHGADSRAEVVHSENTTQLSNITGDSQSTIESPARRSFANE